MKTKRVLDSCISHYHVSSARNWVYALKMLYPYDREDTGQQTDDYRYINDCLDEAIARCSGRVRVG